MKIKQLLLKNKKSAYIYALGVFVTAFSNIFMTLAIANAFRLFEAGSQSPIKMGLTSLGLASLTIIGQVISRFLRIGFMTDILKDVRHLAYDKIMNLSTEDFNKEERDHYRSLMISDINLFEKDFFLSILNIGFSILNTFFSLILIAYLSWQIALISLLTAFILFFVTKGFEKKTRLKQKQTQTQNKTFNNSVSNLVSGTSTIKQFAREPQFLKYFYTETEKLHALKSDTFALHEAQSTSSENIAYLAQLSMMILATIKMGQGELILAQLVMIINLSSSVIWSMLSCFNFINRLKASIDVFNNIVQFESTPSIGTKPQTPLYYKAENLSFSYEENKPILDNLKFDIQPKDKVLIHGPSGTGKTTLLNTLSQNLSDYKGTLTLNHRDLNTISHDDFLELSAYVRQSHFMFDDTIKNNIILNRPFDKKRYETVLKQAALNEWLKDNDSIELIENGKNISGGQRQRISIARALYSDYELIFIDEPSASLDDENAKIIYDTIIHLDKTVVCVSHRHLDYLQKHFDTVIAFEPRKEVVS